jgi:hypothetical protein
MDKINKLSTKFVNFIKQLIPTVILVLVLNIMLNYIKAMQNYLPWFQWWSKNKGNQYGSTLDLTSLALFNYSKITFNIRQLFISGPKQINETSILLLQSIVLNKIRLNNEATVQNFTTPFHLCKSISWGDTEPVDFCNAANEFYTKNNDQISTWKMPPDANGNYVEQSIVTTFINTLLPNIIKSTPSAYNSSWRSGGDGTDGGTNGGFWPHLNGCSGFFDIPNITGISPVGGKYNLFDNIPVVRILDGKTNTYNRPPFYVPGHNSCLGSWAQLFADWGIAYTINSSSGTSTVPVISDGAICQTGDAGTAIQPCPNTGMKWCPPYAGNNPKTGQPYGTGDPCHGDGNDKYASSLPLSDTTTWYETGKSNGGNNIGVNFLGTYLIHPASYIITSWVADLYDDPKTGIIFDAQAFRNLVGYKGANSLSDKQDGGWIMFLKGLNTNITSYDNVMNELFRQYATDFTARAQLPGPKCTGGDKTAKQGQGAISGIMSGVMMGEAIFPGGGGIVGGVIGAFAGAFFGGKECE